VPTGNLPGPVSAGSGSIWVGNLEDKSLTRIDPASRAVVDTISLDATPTGVAFGAGSVWVAHGLTGQLSRLDPQLGGIRTFDVARTELRSVVGAVAFGVDAVWAVYSDATFARLDPASERLRRTFAGSRPTAVVEGGGAVWIVSSGDSTVYRFTPATFLAGPIGRTNVGRRSTAIAYGQGAVWVTSRGDDVVTRIHPSTNSTLQIAVGDEPAAVAVGDDAVWVANAGDGTVSRIDPATSKVVATIDVGHAPSGIVVARGLVLVTVQAP
jgi:YVTN family beta-propeller protein